MGNLNSDYHMAAVSSIRRAYYRSRKPLASAGPEFCLRPSDWLRQTHFLPVPEHCAGALYNPYGVIHDRRGFHLCGRGANPHQWPVDDCVSCNRCRSDPDPHSGNRSGLELLQAPAGNCRTVHRCWCSVDMFNASQFEKPEVPHSVVTAADGSQWYQMASGEGRGAFYDVPTFHGVGADIPNTAAGDGVSGASQPGESGQSFGETLTHDGVEGHPGMVTYPGAADGIGAADTPAPESTLLTGVAASPVGGGDQPPIGYGNGAPSVDTVYGNAPEAQHFGAAYAGGFGESPQNGAQFADHGENVGQGFYSEAPLVAATFPSAPEGTSLRTVGDGVIEASSPDGGNTLWYNSAYYQEPDAPHSVMQSSNGVDWYAMQQQGNIPQFEVGEAAAAYNQAAFQNFIPIGGKNTNCIIAGHRGWGGASYFRYVDKLQPGDEVIITNLWETLQYRVAEIQIIQPNEVEQILIKPGQELVTLLTCHPYASGGRQRYLVICERVNENN